MPQQRPLPGFEEWLSESEAAAFVGLDSETLADSRQGHWVGITPCWERAGEFYYCLADLELWMEINAQRKARPKPGK